VTVESDGFAMHSALLGEQQCEALARTLGPTDCAGRRGILARAEVAELARSPKIGALLRPLLPDDPRPVRAIFFNKSPAMNWLVAWHQDLTIAVRERHEVAGFGPWSVKDGIPHVQPPPRLLERMITLRIHLDQTDENNGALRVIPGSHLHGRLDNPAIQSFRDKTPEVICRAKTGDALLMRPLLLHASSRSTSERQRRILHIEYAAFELPSPLRWHEAD
jgi:ectoine hydroxylase-related dioxygenase (phytanoyl-CoA dioxygenase family)